MASTDPILIAGGGIGGLTAALALARVGRRSIVLERAPEIKEIGAGIQLGPNAFRAFDYLGVGEQARSMAVFIETLRMMDAVTAEEIVSLPLDETFVGRFRDPYAVIHRGDLHGVFLRACKANDLIELRTSAEVVRYEQDGAGVEVMLANGDCVCGVALVGADGLLSKTRAQLVGDGGPRVSGHTTYRSVIPTERMPEELRWNAMTIWVGPKCHLVHYPLSGWKVFNLVVTFHNDASEAVAGMPVTHEEVSRGFAHIHPKARQIIERGTDWKLWVLCDRDPVETWCDGRVVLLGDAAHPMMQYLAQGACMAMEDSVRLSLEVEAAGSDMESAFEAYQRARTARTARVQIDARRMGDLIFHPSGDEARRRNEIMRAMSAKDYFDQMDWLYSYAPDAHLPALGVKSA